MHAAGRERIREILLPRANVASGIRDLVIIGYYAISYVFSYVLTIPQLRRFAYFILFFDRLLKQFLEAMYCRVLYQYRGNSEVK